MKKSALLTSLVLVFLFSMSCKRNCECSEEYQRWYTLSTGTKYCEAIKPNGKASSQKKKSDCANFITETGTKDSANVHYEYRTVSECAIR